jgi:hypothetical protein
MQLRRLARTALDAGDPAIKLQRARGEFVPTFTHFLDPPILFLIIALGAVRPATRTLFFAGWFAALCAYNLQRS